MSEIGFSLNHLCVRVKIPGPSVSVNCINFCTVDQLKFELCEDAVGKKAANASDNKTSGFSTPSNLHRKAVARPSGLKKQVKQPDDSQLFSTTFLCQKHIL